jgi:putative solute:sodium symporter small subunit
MAAQGALIIYVALVGYYAYRMDKLDQEFDMQERDN